MARNIAAAVICHGRLIRDTITETLISEGIAIAWAGDSLEGYDPGFGPIDVGIYVFSGIHEAQERSEAKRLLKLDVRNWLVLCDDKYNALCAALFAEDNPVCTAPIDVTRSDLIHLVHLAAGNRRLSVDNMCERCPSTMINPLADASLKNDQLQLMRYLSEGYSNKQIARIEGCSESLVKIRMRALLDKLGAGNRTQAAAMAARAGLTFHSNDTSSPPSFARRATV